MKKCPDVSAMRWFLEGFDVFICNSDSIEVKNRKVFYLKTKDYRKTYPLKLFVN